MRLIDADSVLKGIDELRKSPWYNAGKEIGVDPFAHVGFLERKEAIGIIVALCIKSAPTVDVELVRHGRWINKEVFYCSECNAPSMRRWPYCEMCGAKMDGDKNPAFADQSGAEHADNPTV